MLLLINKKEIIELEIAKTIFSRMKGLMGVKEVKKALYFYPCNNIHTFFMKVPIDVLYINKQGYIIDMNISIKPWKIGKLVKKSSTVIELPEGTIERYSIKLNQYVQLKK